MADGPKTHAIHLTKVIGARGSINYDRYAVSEAGVVSPPARRIRGGERSSTRTRRLPRVNELADAVRGQRVASKTRVRDSLAFVVARRAELERFATVEDLAVATVGDNPDPGAEALAFHLQGIRNRLAAALWPLGIFIGPSVLDDLLFYAAKDPAVTDPLLAALQYLRDRRANQPGLIVFPLHSVNVLAGGLLRGRERERIQYVHGEWGIALTPQTNSMNDTLAFLERARRECGVHKPIDRELLRHWFRSRARWLERNPMLVIRFVSQRGSYYDTEFFVMGRIEAATSVLCMVACFQPRRDDEAARRARLWSTSRTNNFETLDIHHYIVLFDNPNERNALDGDCVPIHSAKGAIAELTELNVEIDPTYLPRRHKLFGDIEAAVDEVYGRYLQHVTGARDTASTRAARRMFEALAYFRRSVHASRGEWQTVISLATAYEMLLTDHYGGGVSERLKRRVALVLRGLEGTRRYQQAFSDLYEARGALVHSGAIGKGEVDLPLAQQGFVHIFCRLSTRLAGVNRRSETPMRDLTGDAGSAGGE